MSDYISREAALGCLYNTLESYYVKRNIMDLPAADVKPVVHGHWEDRGSLSARCSECGCKTLNASDFCPNCGADMRENDGEGAKRIKKQLALNGLGYPYDLPNREV